MENYNLLSLTITQKQGTAHKGTYYVAPLDEDNNTSAVENNRTDNSSTTISDIKEIKSLIDYDTDTIELNGKVTDILGTISDEELEKIYEKTLPELNSTTSPVSKFATTYKSYSPTDVAKIKGIIYKIHHPSGNGSSGGINDEPDPVVSNEPTPSPAVSEEPSPTPSEVLGEGEGTGSSFISAKYNNFYNAETMFEYLETITGGQITKATGITRTQLVKLTQNEVAETENNGFFGALNRIFNNTTHFNTDNNNVLSFEEIDTLFQTLGYANELGEAPTNFLNKVQQYTEEIQAEYESLSTQKKLEFIIDRTREYLEAAGLQDQLNALNRLTSRTDTESGGTYKVGQIALADLNPGLQIRPGQGYTMTNGAYSCMSTPPANTVGDWPYTGSEHPKKSGNLYYDVSLFYSDDDYVNDDSEGVDLGLTLDIRKVDSSYDSNYNQYVGISSWYDMVDVLVHELTHATAYQYATINSSTGEALDDVSTLKVFNESQLTILHNKGLINDSDWTYYQNYKNKDLVELYNEPNGESKLNEYMKVVSNLMYVTSCMWGEYAAYQADADYLDSIAGDVFNSASNRFNNDSFDNAVAGASEKNSILEHIWQLYDDNGRGNIDQGMGVTEYEAYPEGTLNDAIFTYNKRKNWTWA